MVLQTFTNDQPNGIKKSFDVKGICTESKWDNGEEA
jgi:hypothetical protein